MDDFQMTMRTIEIKPISDDNSAAIRAALHELRDGGRLVAHLPAFDNM